MPTYSEVKKLEKEEKIIEKEIENIEVAEEKIEKVEKDIGDFEKLIVRALSQRPMAAILQSSYALKQLVYRRKLTTLVSPNINFFLLFLSLLP